MFDEIKNINYSTKSLKQFCLLIGFIILGVCGWIYYKYLQLYMVMLVISLLLILCGVLKPKLMKPLYFIWMTIALMMGWFMSKIILFIYSFSCVFIHYSYSYSYYLFLIIC